MKRQMTRTDSQTQNLEAYRPAITGHCYRMLGSFFDAEDATQEAMLRAWKGMEQFDGRASLKNWLYRIATNVCLDEIHSRGGGRAPWKKARRFPAAPRWKTSCNGLPASGLSRSPTPRPCPPIPIRLSGRF